MILPFVVAGFLLGMAITLLLAEPGRGPPAVCPACCAELQAGVSELLRLARASQQLIERTEEEMSAELDALTAQVAENTSVEKSAVQLIQNIAAKLEAAQDDPAQIAALSAQLKNSADALAAEITANTAPAPAPAEAPAEAPVQ